MSENEIDEKVAINQLLESIIENPSVYTIDVLDNKMLPEKIKSKKTLDFEIKPPVMSTLAKIAVVTNKLPFEISQKEMQFQELAKHFPEMCEILAILCHGSSSKTLPSWYVPFMMSNLTPQDAIHIFQESLLKIRTDFFLPFFHHAEQVNPMMMKKRKEE